MTQQAPAPATSARISLGLSDLTLNDRNGLPAVSISLADRDSLKSLQDVLRANGETSEAVVVFRAGKRFRERLRSQPDLRIGIAAVDLSVRSAR